MAKIINFIATCAESVLYATLIAVFLLIGGCATKPEVRVEYVQSVQKEPPIIPRPELDTDYLKPGMDAGSVLQAHRLTIIKLLQWGLEQETILDSYRTKGK